ncbi:MAG: RND family efflux transporter MFP subunit [Hyphomicrobiaceae bacterium]|jgi:RND family efflux transporter MFP subunit
MDDRHSREARGNRPTCNSRNARPSTKFGSVRRARCGIGYFAALLLATSSIVACEGPTDALTARSSEGEALVVVVTQPERVTARRTTTLPGSLEAWEQAPLFARVTGYVADVAVDIGSKVKSGQPLATITVPEMAPTLAGARARRDQEQAQLAMARLTRKRTAGLRSANRNAVSSQTVDETAAAEQIEIAQLALANAEVQRLEALAGFGTLLAPFDGVITKRNLDPGALAREGTTPGAMAVLEIARVDKLRLIFDVPEKMLAAATTGNEIAIRFDALPGRTIAGQVARSSGTLDPSTRSLRAQVDVDNSAQELTPGMYASVTLSMAATPGWTLPSRAVRGEGDRRYVLVVSDGVCRRADVTVADDDGRQATVVDGVSESTSVVIAGSPLARDGAACRTSEDAQP